MEIDARILARIAKLERRCRMFEAALLVLVAAVVGVVLTGASKPVVLKAKTVEAQEFVLRDQDGRVHAGLGMDEGMTVLELQDDPKAHRLILALGPEGRPFIRLTGDKDENRVLLTVGEADQPHLVLYANKEEVVFQAPSKP